MFVLKNRNSFSVIGVSIAGGVTHNLGQLIVAMVVVESYKVGFHFPVLMIAGMLTGLLIGILSKEVLKRLKNFHVKE